MRRTCLGVLFVFSTLLSAFPSVQASAATQDSVSFSGTFVDSSGTPIPGAHLWLSSPAASVSTGYSITDSNGQFSFNVPPSDDYRLIVNGNGVPYNSQPFVLNTMAVQGIDLSADLIGQTVSLPAPVPYGVRVSNEAGTAVSGAVVGFHYSSCVLGSSEGLTTSFPSTFFLGDETITQKFVTDSSGVGTINVLPCTTNGTPLSIDVTPPSTADGSQLVTTAAALVPFPSADESSSPPVVVLHHRPLPVTFAGTLTAGDGVTGVEGIALTMQGRGSFTTTTAADGSFSFIVEPNTYSLLVDGRGTSYPFQYQVDGIALSSSLRDQKISFPADQGYLLSVVDNSGAPVAGAQVVQIGATGDLGGADPRCWLTRSLTTSFPVSNLSTGTGDAPISGTSDATGPSLSASRPPVRNRDLEHSTPTIMSMCCRLRVRA